MNNFETNSSFIKAKEELESYRLRITETRVLVEKINKLEHEITSAGGTLVLPEGGTVKSLTTKIAYLTDLKEELNKKLKVAESCLLVIDNRISKLSSEDAHYLSMKFIMLVPSKVIAYHDGYSNIHVRRKIVEAVHHYANLYFA